MIYKIHPVNGINEVNTHYLEVLNARFLAESFAATDGKVMDMKMETNGHHQPQQGGGDVDGLEGLNAKEKVVFKMIQAALADQSEVGFSRSEIINRFPHYTKDEIDQMLEKMTNDGLIYTTVDSDHFSACY